jgi:hypothetical protein
MRRQATLAEKYFGIVLSHTVFPPRNFPSRFYVQNVATD